MINIEPWTKTALNALKSAYEQTEPYGLLEICDQSNITIERSRHTQGLGYLKGWRNRRFSPMRIVLHSDICNPCFDFVAYHELAHYFLLEANVPLVLSGKEYWIVEEWCDNFARVKTGLHDVCSDCNAPLKLKTTA